MTRLASFLLLLTVASIGNVVAAGNKPAAPLSPAASNAKSTQRPKDADAKKFEEPAPGVDEDKSKAQTPALELKNKSSFEMEGDNRNPFWPIGWKPAESTPNTTEHAAGEIPTTAFVVTSITMDPVTRFAIVNGKTMQEGQQFGLQVGSQTYQLTVKAIQDGKVILSRRNQEIIVPLRRK